MSQPMYVIEKPSNMIEDIVRAFRFLLCSVLVICIALLLWSLFDRVSIYGTVVDSNVQVFEGATVVALMNNVEVARTTSLGGSSSEKGWNFSINLPGNYGMNTSLPGSSQDVSVGNLTINEAKNIYLDNGKVLLQLICFLESAPSAYTIASSLQVPSATGTNYAFNWTILLFGHALASGAALASNVVASWVQLKSRSHLLVAVIIFIVLSFISFYISMNY